MPSTQPTDQSEQKRLDALLKRHLQFVGSGRYCFQNPISMIRELPDSKSVFLPQKVELLNGDVRQAHCRDCRAVRYRQCIVAVGGGFSTETQISLYRIKDVEYQDT
jgi:hypothetical protein